MPPETIWRHFYTTENPKLGLRQELGGETSGSSDSPRALSSSRAGGGPDDASAINSGITRTLHGDRYSSGRCTRTHRRNGLNIFAGWRPKAKRCGI